MILAGEQEATLQAVRLLDIHGSRFYDLAYTHDDKGGELRQARLAFEDVYAEPAPGDAVSVSYLMGVATRLAKR